MDQRKKMIELVRTFLQTGSEGDNLADYLTENGCVVIPCKVGDTLYSSAHSDNGEKIEEFSVVFVGMVSLDSRWVVLYQKISADEREGNDMLPKTYECRFDEIGKKVFTSEKEAMEKGGENDAIQET